MVALDTSKPAEKVKENDIEAAVGVDPKDKLLFGRYNVPPERVVFYIIAAFVAFFVFHRVTDIAYFLTADCSFPKGMGYLYDNDGERLRCVAYTRQIVTVGIVWSTVTFVVVMCIVLTRFMITLDGYVAELIATASRWLECLPGYSCCSQCTSCLSRNFCCLCDAVGLAPKWGQLFHGAVYLTLTSTFFAIIDTPFKIWYYSVSVRFGFSNVVTQSLAEYKWAQIMGILSGLGNIPSYMFYLWILSWKFGWLLMWATMCFILTVGQYNLASLVPWVLGPVEIFPSSDFGVGRGFPLVPHTHATDSSKFISLNRIYYPTSEQNKYETHDLSKGHVELDFLAEKPGDRALWQLKDQEVIDGDDDDATLAVTKAKIVFHNNSRDLDTVAKKQWSVHSNESARKARISSRNGGELRNSLLKFAEERNIPVSQVYMVDGSHSDARANAFAAGAGSQKIIALYDTLFLGQNNSINLADQTVTPETYLSIKRLSKVLRGVPASQMHVKPHWHSAPTSAMTDIEILAVMGHELGHTALHHAEIGIVEETLQSFSTFALLGWVVHSPVFAAGLGLSMPVVHIAFWMYARVVNVVLDGFLDPIGNALSRVHEFQADAYSARVSKAYADGLQTALTKLTISCAMGPREPWYYEMLHDDHPTTVRRWEAVERIKRRLYPEK